MRWWKRKKCTVEFDDQQAMWDFLDRRPSASVQARYVIGTLPGDVLTLCCREHGFLDVPGGLEGNPWTFVDVAEAHEMEAHDD